MGEIDETHPREDGFYWVLPPRGQPEVARWLRYTETWLMAGSELDCGDDEVVVLSPRLEPPTK